MQSVGGGTDIDGGKFPPYGGNFGEEIMKYYKLQFVYVIDG
jgi:hypothetical protein